jgi:hypothetical protein
MKTGTNPELLPRILDISSFVAVMAGFAFLIGAYLNADLQFLSIPALGMLICGLLYGTR